MPYLHITAWAIAYPVSTHPLGEQQPIFQAAVHSVGTTQILNNHPPNLGLVKPLESAKQV